VGDVQLRLMDQVLDGIRRKHYSIRTEQQQAYVEGIRRFVLLYNKRHPRDMGAEEVEAFPTHLGAGVVFSESLIMFFPILRGQWWLFVGACVSLAIALLHVVVVLIGPDAYSFFGGPGLARQAESGSWQPALMTLVLAWLFIVFAAYGLSGAGFIRRLPLLAGVLLLIGGLYTFRGLSIVGQIAQYLSTPGSPPLRVVLYSLIAWPVSATSTGPYRAGST
jgi:hypothetical protein